MSVRVRDVSQDPQKPGPGLCVFSMLLDSVSILALR